MLCIVRVRPGGPGEFARAPAWPRAVARGRRGGKNIFWAGVRACAGARGENIFFKLSVVRFGGHTDGGGGRCFRLLDRGESSISASFS